MANNTIGEKELKTKWPVVTGTEFGTNKTSARVASLVPKGLNGKKSLVKSSDKTGIY